MISLVCPSCGHENFDPLKQCICGYHADETFIARSDEKKKTSVDETFIAGSDEKKKTLVIETRRKELKNIVKTLINTKSNNPLDEIVIKEVDSWIFSFSPEDKCIHLGTPALQSFKLRLSVDDLEELLEIAYQHTGREKTVMKLRLPAEELTDLIDKVHRLIEYKKSKMHITFELPELQEIADLITAKFKE